MGRHNADLLRSGRLGEADLKHIAEEIEDISKSVRRALETRLIQLLQQLLKWQAQPVKRDPRWRRTIVEQRFRLRRLLDESPSLRREIPGILAEIHDHAVNLASLDTGLPAGTWATVCRWSVEDMLSDVFWPGETGRK